MQNEFMSSFSRQSYRVHMWYKNVQKDIAPKGFGKRAMGYLKFLVWKMLEKLFRYRWQQDCEIFKTKIIAIRL